MPRRSFQFSGFVQGRGFRPSLHRLARAHGLTGWVRNSRSHVLVEAQGVSTELRGFQTDILQSFSEGVRVSVADLPEVPRETTFVILPSDSGISNVGDLPVDIATCGSCLEELYDPENRRYRYPFITCAECGPRFSISRTMPYDRERTSMAEFPMCVACKAEYASSSNRRFHAETTCCPDCGPTLTFLDADGVVIAGGDESMELALRALSDGKIVAVKSVGGFHLMVDAGNETAVQRLRQRKHRPRKPFAVLLNNISTARQYCDLSAAEEINLLSPAAPIVLAKAKSVPDLCAAVAPGLGIRGVFLASNPLHHLLSQAFGGPLVATSANRSGEPLCFEIEEAKSRLKGIADYFLDHNRGILRPVDDSILRVIEDRPTLFRRARGYPQRLKELVQSNSDVLGTGGFLKNTFAWTENENLYLSPHLGDLDHPLAQKIFRERTQEIPARQIRAADLHPDYPGRRLSPPGAKVWAGVPHHRAHILSGMADNGLTPPLLGVAWDGIGLGEGGLLWGGESFDVSPGAWKRVASFLPFRLIGGERAIREPRRVALALLWQSDSALPDHKFGYSVSELTTLRSLYDKGLNSPFCSSVGRLFDGIAAITGIARETSYEGEAALLVETAAERWPDDVEPSTIERNGIYWDWRNLVREIHQLTGEGQSPEILCSRFHATLAQVVGRTAESVGHRQVLLSGGCFQNRLLSRLTISALREKGFTPYWHHDIPPNDGGLSVGQVMFARESLCV